MPLVTIKYDSNIVSKKILKYLTKILPDIVARALHVKERTDGYLTPEDIEVEVKKHGKFDVNTLALQITIVANDYPQRKKNLEDRTTSIINDLLRHPIIKDNSFISKKQAFVWVLLCPGGFKML